MRKEFVSVTVRSVCAHCGKPMELTIDSDLKCEARGEGCEPIVFVPDVNVIDLEDESIIGAF